MPLEFDAESPTELILRLPPPHQNIILTPPRDTDVALALEYHNDPRVYRFLSGPPFPYTRADGEGWHRLIADGCAAGQAQYRDVSAGRRRWADAVPFRSIREVDPATGGRRFLGDVGLDRCRYDYDMDKDAAGRQRARALNAGREAGSGEIEWAFGDYLAPSHHGRGIMTAAVRAVIEEFAVPYMNAHKISAGFFENNIASKRVFEKAGFVFKGWDQTPLPIQESKGGGEVIQGTLFWERS